MLYFIIIQRAWYQTMVIVPTLRKKTEPKRCPLGTVFEIYPAQMSNREPRREYHKAGHYLTIMLPKPLMKI